MALSGSVATGEMEGRSVTLSWTATQSVANNTSTVSWTLKTTGSYAYGVAVREVSAKINGNSVYHCDNLNTIYGGNVPANYTIATGSFTVAHNSDGAGSFTAYVGAGIYYQWAINTENTKTFTLDTIARASKVKITSGFTLGSQGTIQIYSVASTSFKHTLRYAWGSESGTIAQNLTTSGTTIDQNWTPPINPFANYIPNDTTGYGTIYCDTYSGSTKIGTSSVAFYGTLPSSVVPTISNLAVALDNSANSVIAGWGVAVKGYTKARLTASGAGVYDSSISSFAITGGYTASVVGSSLDYTGEPISSSGTVNFSVSSVDTRGRSSAAASKSLTVYDYTNPAITVFTVNRNSSSTTKVIVNANWTFASVNSKNAATVTLKYKTRSASSWTTYSGTITKNGDTTLTPTFALNTSYDFQLTVTDSVGNSATAVGSVSTQDVLLDFRAGGSGLGVGKIIESDYLFEVNPDWDCKMHGKEILTLIGDKITSEKCVKYSGTGDVGDANTPIYLAAGVPTAITNNGKYHAFTINTAQQAASAWKSVATDTASWTLPAGIYIVNFAITAKGSSATMGLCTCRLYRTDSSVEWGASDGNLSRVTVPLSSGANSTMNVSFMHKQASEGSIIVRPEIWGSQAFTVASAFTSIVRVADTWTT